MALYFIGGVNGVGKSSLCSAVANQSDKYWYINGSSLLMERLGIRDGDYDSLRSCPEKLKSDAMVELLADVRKRTEQSGQIGLYCGHFVKLYLGKNFSSKGAWFKEVDGLMLVWSTPSAILQRIHLDEKTGRRTNRALFFNSSNFYKMLCLTRAQLLSYSVAISQARKYHKPLKITFNRQGEFSKSLERFKNSIIK